jgi:hypothetical protein
LIDRRTFLAGALAAGLVPRAIARAAEPRPGSATAPSPALAAALEASPFVYVSPLRADGAESTCHGEVWFAALDGAAVIITAHDRWKARALARGLDRARVWVGDHGPWSRLLGKNEAFRSAPSFDARASLANDPKLLDRLIAAYERKYPREIADWRDRFRKGFADGSRVLIRYTPA